MEQAPQYSGRLDVSLRADGGMPDMHEGPSDLLYMLEK